jgi:hypothetical protein
MEGQTPLIVLAMCGEYPKAKRQRSLSHIPLYMIRRPGHPLSGAERYALSRRRAMPGPMLRSFTTVQMYTRPGYTLRYLLISERCST